MPQAPLPDSGEAAAREKSKVAMWSLSAALALVTIKLIVGLATNSLGILSEALHSGLDVVATGMTWWAVWFAGKPADTDHTYGHGKVENLSALAETAILAVVCVWIVYEAVARMFFRAELHVETSVWAFVVVVGAIGVDGWRARALSRAARKYQSQALQADALHFSTDIWSSLVVLVGLAGVWGAEHWGMQWLVQADSVAALLVAMLVLSVSYRLARNAIDELLDRTSAEQINRVRRAAASVAGVESVHDVRVRRSGAAVFSDLTVTASRHHSFEQAHELADQVGQAVRDELAGADVVVHVEPVATPDEHLLETVRVLASRRQMAVHDVRLLKEQSGDVLELHLEVDPTLSLDAAHDAATGLEQELKRQLTSVVRVVTHIEPAERRAEAESVRVPQAVQAAVDAFVERAGVPLRPHNIRTRRCGAGLALTFDCELEADTNIADAHELSSRFERHLRAQVPELVRVVIHMEPKQGGTASDHG